MTGAYILRMRTVKGLGNVGENLHSYFERVLIEEKNTSPIPIRCSRILPLPDTCVC